MPYSAIIAFDCISFCLRLNVFYIRKKFLIALPIVRIIHRCRNVFYLLPKLHPCICASVPTDKRDKSFSKSINSNPYPTVVFLNLYMCASHLIQQLKQVPLFVVKPPFHPILLPNSKQLYDLFSICVRLL